MQVVSGAKPGRSNQLAEAIALAAGVVSKSSVASEAELHIHILNIFTATRLLSSRTPLLVGF